MTSHVSKFCPLSGQFTLNVEQHNLSRFTEER